MQNLQTFLDETKRITLLDLANGHNVDVLLRNTTEELGEFCAAVTIESGIKVKPLKESSQQEAVDVVICALSLFFAQGGNTDELVSYGHQKLKKWEARQ